MDSGEKEEYRVEIDKKTVAEILEEEVEQAPEDEEIAIYTGFFRQKIASKANQNYRTGPIERMLADLSKPSKGFLEPGDAHTDKGKEWHINRGKVEEEDIVDYIEDSYLVNSLTDQKFNNPAKLQP